MDVVVSDVMESLIHCSVTCIKYHDEWVHDISPWSNALSRYDGHNNLQTNINMHAFPKDISPYSFHMHYLVHDLCVYILECDKGVFLHAYGTSLEAELLVYIRVQNIHGHLHEIDIILSLDFG